MSRFGVIQVHAHTKNIKVYIFISGRESFKKKKNTESFRLIERRFSEEQSFEKFGARLGN